MKKQGRISNLIISINKYPSIPKVAGVYKVTCLKTNRSYIGSSNNVNQRAHYYTNKNANTKAHLPEIDFDYIKFELLDDCRYLKESLRLELELQRIIEHNTVYPIGFNKRSPVTNEAFNKKIKPVKIKKAFKSLPTQNSAKGKTPKQYTNYGKQPKLYHNVLK